MEIKKLRVPERDYIITDSIVDGPGLRTTIFVQGCPHNCPGCHNPQTHDFNAGKLIDIEDIYKVIKLNKGVKGITFSGGEPFCQALAFSELAKRLKEDGYKIAVYSGWTFEELIQKNIPGAIDLLKNIDILIDGKFDKTQRSLDISFRGSKNQRILNVPKSLIENKAVWTEDPSWLVKEMSGFDIFPAKNIKEFGK